MAEAADIDKFCEAILSERRQQRRSVVVRSWLIRVAFMVLFVGTWQFVAWAEIIDPVFISTPAETASVLWGRLVDGSLWEHVWDTFVAAIFGLVLGSLMGIGAGILLAYTPVLHRGMKPFLTTFNALPRPALAPIFILWFGIGTSAKVSVAVTIVFFVLLLNTLAGMSAKQDDFVLLAKSLGMSPVQRFLEIDLPHALPSIVAGLRLGAVYSVLGVVVAEIIASKRGLGQLLVRDSNNFDIAGSFGILLVMALLAAVLDFAISLAQRRFVYWEESDR